MFLKPASDKSMIDGYPSISIEHSVFELSKLMTRQEVFGPEIFVIDVQLQIHVVILMGKRSNT